MLLYMVFESGVFLFAEDCPYVAKYKKPGPEFRRGFYYVYVPECLFLKTW